MIDGNNRRKLQQLLDDHNLTQAQGAALICQQTERPCSVRAIRSWLNNPEKSSARTCPDWAILALEKAINVKENMQTVTAPPSM
ncbi:hypothetical protein ACO0LB_17850 [Undibacterium sp. SXout7W]|uniref:hypothetical protein n=1 Tax=Undibacterium sp. SXout7W TaxID=3413049 RepID=UPI003BF21ABA